VFSRIGRAALNTNASDREDPLAIGQLLQRDEGCGNVTAAVIGDRGA
jgi:hypothetical protein